MVSEVEERMRRSSVGEIATKIGASRQTVYSRLRRAVRSSNPSDRKEFIYDGHYAVTEKGINYLKTLRNAPRGRRIKDI